MDEYTLFLDESKNKERTLFTISGIIIKDGNLEKLYSGINDVKKCIWADGYNDGDYPVLHCVELSIINNNRKNKKFLSTYLKSHSTFSILGSKSDAEIRKIYDNVYSLFSKTLKETDCITIGCLIDIQKFKYIYGNSISSNGELLFEVAMQEIIENYAHFLLNVNGIGNIVYESRNDELALTNKSPDFKMYDNFCKIKSCNKGISFINQENIAKTIRYFYVYDKSEDIPGLQFADFVAYNVLHNINRTKEQYSEFMKKILKRLYNGGHDLSVKDLRDYFGLKKLPYDFETIHRLKDENATIKKSYDSIKMERNSLKKKNESLIDKKDKLIKQNDSFKDDIKQLKAEIEKSKKYKENIDNLN